MTEQAPTRCSCPRCRVRSVMGPVILITIGVIFLLGQYHHHFPIIRYWPIILIVIGVVKVLESVASTEGHLGP